MQAHKTQNQGQSDGIDRLKAELDAASRRTSRETGSVVSDIILPRLFHLRVTGSDGRFVVEGYPNDIFVGNDEKGLRRRELFDKGTKGAVDEAVKILASAGVTVDGRWNSGPLPPETEKTIAEKIRLVNAIRDAWKNGKH